LNPFIWPILSVGALFVSRCYYRNTKSPGRLRKWVMVMTSGRGSLIVCMFLLLSILGACSFEMYFRVFKCRVSEHYTRDVLALAQSVGHILSSRQITYWYDFGTLLAIVRNRHNSWDTNIDLSIMRPAEQSDVDELLALLRTRYPSTYDESRDLFIVHKTKSSSSPFIIIYCWQIDHEAFPGTKKFLATRDYTIAYRWREWHHMFPLRHQQWMRLNVTIPNDSASICKLEYEEQYGVDFMTPLVLRENCFFNFFNTRWIY
jgi:hypothetical protein